MEDLFYILYNTTVYGLFAFVIMSFFNYNKYLNFALGIFMIIGSFLIYSVYNNGFERQSLIIFVGTVLIYVLSNYLMLKYFKNTKKRDLIGLIFTFGLSVVLLNITTIIYGPNSVNIGGELSIKSVFGILIALNIIIYYFQKNTIFGTILKGISENDKTTKSLGIPVNKILFVLNIIFLGMLFLCGYLILIGSNIKSGDSMFFLIKGIGIMILVGVSKSELVFVGSLLYVLIEYLLFIKLGLPISYKETLILVIILGMLIFKPQGLFSVGGRKL